MAKKTHNPKIEIIGKKGTTTQYVKVTNTKGKKNTYKLANGIPIDFYVQASKKKWNTQERNKRIKEWNRETPGKQLKNYTNRLKKNKTLSRQFKTGITSVSTTLEELQKSGTVRRIYTKLLGPLVLDKQLLNIILENRQKLKERFSYHLEAYGKIKDRTETTKIGDIQHIGRNTIEEIKGIYLDKLGYKPGKKIQQQEYEQAAMNIGLPPKTAHTYTESDGATLEYTKITISFQRG